MSDDEVSGGAGAAGSGRGEEEGREGGTIGAAPRANAGLDEKDEISKFKAFVVMTGSRWGRVGFLALRVAVGPSRRGPARGWAGRASGFSGAPGSSLRSRGADGAAPGSAGGGRARARARSQRCRRLLSSLAQTSAARGATGPFERAQGVRARPAGSWGPAGFSGRRRGTRDASGTRPGPEDPRAPSCRRRSTFASTLEAASGRSLLYAGGERRGILERKGRTDGGVEEG